MLETLRIKNIAVIDTADIPFKPGLNILSGETGAGKSIVIASISLLLGSRASADLIRAGAEEGVVEGLFNISAIPWIQDRLKSLGFSGDSTELLIKRIVHRAGRHRIYVNGELATLAILQELCEGLVDLCGQHEHQTLLKAQTQLELLDRFGGFSELAQKYSQGFHTFRSVKREREALEKAEAERTRRADFVRFQIEELKQADLQPGEDQSLHEQKKLLQSAETRVQLAEQARQALEGDEQGALEGLRFASQKLRSLENMDHRLTPAVEAMERALAEAEEVSLEINRYLAHADIDPDELSRVQERLSLIADLRRKYGSSVDEMLQTLSELEKESLELGNFETKLEELTREVQAAEKHLRDVAKKLSQSRSKAAVLLSDSVTSELKDLKMGEAHFAIDLHPKEDLETWNALGADQIQYLVQTNRGETARPLGKVASGGELSRIMLAIRRVIADRGGIGVYLFDEIDAGIGGQTAFEVGKKLRSVASYNQVICITHLPQVASFADHHLSVRKSPKGKRTLTEIVELTSDEQKQELARMLGGPELTRKTLENAAELIQMANQSP